MELNYLRDFVVLAETCQFQEAAEQLYISQSSLSKHIKTIEQEFGESLFDRSTRCVELTRFGRDFLPYAQKIVGVQSEYMNVLLPEYSGKESVISIGISPQISFYSISNLLSNFSRSNTKYSIKLFENEGTTLLDMLNRRKCSAVISAMNPILHRDYSGYETIPLFEDTLVAILPANHPLANQDTVTVKDLANNNYIQLGHDFESDPALGRPIIYVSRSAMVIELVKKGLGTSIITKTAAQNHPEEGIVYVDMSPTPTLQVCMMFVKGQSRTPEARALFKHLQTHVTAAGKTADDSDHTEA